MMKFFTPRSLLILLTILAFAAVGVALVKKSSPVSARRCMKEGQQGEAPLQCCRGLTQLGSSSEFVCTRCGNSKCGAGETLSNCPQDCTPRCKNAGTYQEPFSCCQGLVKRGSTCTRCGNGICEVRLGEGSGNCLADCTAPACVEMNQPVEPSENCCEGLYKHQETGVNSLYCDKCGDGRCDWSHDEGLNTCPEDCRRLCGNGRCETTTIGENRSNCPQDCH